MYNTSDVTLGRSHEKPGNSNINSVNIIVISLLTTTVIILVVIFVGVCFKRKLKSLSCCFRPLYRRTTSTKTELQVLDDSSAF